MVNFNAQPIANVAPNPPVPVQNAQATTTNTLDDRVSAAFLSTQFMYTALSLVGGLAFLIVTTMTVASCTDRQNSEYSCRPEAKPIGMAGMIVSSIVVGMGLYSLLVMICRIVKKTS